MGKLLSSRTMILIIGLLMGALILQGIRKIRNSYFLVSNYESKQSWNDRYHKEDAFSYTPPIDSNSKVFVGDSETAFFNVSECFPPHVRNRGISGNTTLNVLDRIVPITLGKPKKIFIQIGINDLNAYDREPEDIIITYKKIIDTIKSVSPSTKLFIQSIFPVAAPDNSSFLKKIAKTNQLIKQYCDYKQITYINVYDHLLQKDGGVDTSMVYDGLHLNAKGYSVWYNQVKPFID